AAATAACACSSVLPGSWGTKRTFGVAVGWARGVALGGTGEGVGGTSVGVAGTGVADGSEVAVAARTGVLLGTATGLGGTVASVVDGGVGSGGASPWRLRLARPKKPTPSANRTTARASSSPSMPPPAPRPARGRAVRRENGVAVDPGAAAARRGGV